MLTVDQYTGLRIEQLWEYIRVGVYKLRCVQNGIKMCPLRNQKVKHESGSIQRQTVLPNGIRTTGSLLIRPQKRVS
jgi:hypothetical protein